MSGVFSELRRRNVFRVGAAYAVVAWLLVQASDIMLSNFGAPDWVFKTIVAVLIIGFPLALFLAWAYELTPEGVKRVAEVNPAESITPATGRKLDFIIIGVLALALGWFAWDKFLREPGLSVPAVASAADPSIAVLPFADMSPDKDQEYFSDGLSEEILNLLAQIQELKVSGRASSFSFKGKDTPIPEIGELLGVAHVLDGSVRKSGDRVRITAQLVKADDGFHLWSETFDRQLADIFAIQDEIAGAIANALQLRLVGRVAETANLEAYDLYLQARALIYKRNLRDLEEARRLIDRALALDPDYAPALAASGELWLLLSDHSSSYGDIPMVQAIAAARRDLERALGLDPGLADAHAAMGLLSMVLPDYAAADAHFARALAINPSLTHAQHWRALNSSFSGRAQDAVTAGLQLAERDPLFVTNQANLGHYLAVIGDFAAADSLARRLQVRYPDSPSIHRMISGSQRLEGRLAEAKASIDRALSLDANTPYVRLYAEWVHYELGDCARALEYTIGWTETVCLLVLDRGADSPARARLDVRSTNNEAVRGWLQGLSLSGRHEELLAWLDARGDAVAELGVRAQHSATFGAGLKQLAAAQRATGSTIELAATLRAWGELLAFLEANGHATGRFRYAQASHAALSDQPDRALALLADAIDIGFRDPLLGGAPAFEPWHDDPAFQAQVQRNIELINIERARLDMEPLP